MKMKNAILMLLCIAILVCTMSACGESMSVTESTDSTVTFKVTVQTSGGTCLEKVRVRVYSDELMSQLVDMGITNECGEIIFTGIEGHPYTVQLENLPDGYVPEQTYSITGLDSVIMPAVDIMTEASFENVCYSLGDPMMDFQVTAANGETYSLYELLEEKKAVVLNFWYLECNPCKMEFPHIQKVYEKFAGEVELIAMNPVNPDSSAVKDFAEQNGYTFPMAACDSRWNALMGLTAYPTTVVIDRYGSICVIHTGMVTETEPLENMLEYFTSDGYEQQFFMSMSMIPAAAGE